MRFTKMHGIGNDYVYVNAFAESVREPEKLAVKMADRHFGVGGDGLILIAPPTESAKAQGAHVRMRMFNADGSESEMCGNGIRCVAKFAWDHGLARVNPMFVETGRGVLTLNLHLAAGKVNQVTVNMGEPIFDLAAIPVDPTWLSATAHPREFLIPLAGAGAGFAVPATFVSMGNPHAVIFSPDVAKVDLAKLGPLIERHQAFPRRINAHFVQVHSRTEVTMRTWERGSGITLACGTGAAAVCAASVLMNKTDRKILAHLPGGDLTLEWRTAEAGGDDSLYMTGPAVEVFSGDWPQP